MRLKDKSNQGCTENKTVGRKYEWEEWVFCLNKLIY